MLPALPTWTDDSVRAYGQSLYETAARAEAAWENGDEQGCHRRLLQAGYASGDRRDDLGVIFAMKRIGLRLSHPVVQGIA